LKSGTIRWLDALLGSLLCLLLTVWRRLLDAVRPPDLRSPPRRVVFLKLVEQGATVLAAPAVQRAARRVGRENVYFCVFAENRPILDLLDLVPAENVLTLRSGGLGVFAWDALRAIRRLRAAGVDTVIDLEFLARAPAALAYLTGARLRVGLHRYTAGRRTAAT
jgi:ADP-heptose:LPS heptosyltransferase